VDVCSGCCAVLTAARTQGIVGTMPWIALGWLTLYLQLLGFSDLAAAVLTHSSRSAARSAASAEGCWVRRSCARTAHKMDSVSARRTADARLRRGACQDARRRSPTALAALSDTNSTFRRNSTLQHIHMALVQATLWSYMGCLTCPAKLWSPQT